MKRLRIFVGAIILFTCTSSTAFSSQVNNYSSMYNNKIVAATIDLEKVIEFKDEKFEELIREVMDMPEGEIKVKHLRNIEEINTDKLKGDYSTLRDISEIGYCTNLERIYIDNTLIEDLEPLRDMQSITNIRMAANKIKDISPLKNLENLIEISVINNKIKDISVFNEKNTFDKLISINLSSNPIYDFSPIKSLSNLQGLIVWGGRFNDLSIVNDLDKLEVLILSERKPLNFNEMKNMTNLTTLYLSGMKLKNIDFIKELKKIQNLSLRNNDIKDISPLLELNNLENIYISGNKIKDYEVLRPIYSNLKNKDFSLIEIIDLKEESIDLNKREEYSIEGKILPSDAFYSELKYESSNGEIAVVDEHGVIKGLKEGEAVVTVSTVDGVVKSEIKVNVKNNFRKIDSKSNVEKDKVWTIKFSGNIIKSNIKNKINIYDSMGNEIPFNVRYTSDKNTVKIKSVGNYKSGQTYYLVITNDIESIEGEKFQRSYEMMFTIK